MPQIGRSSARAFSYSEKTLCDNDLALSPVLRCGAPGDYECGLGGQRLRLVHESED